MLKKTITFTDYFGEERTQDFYFNLTKAELTEMELSSTGGLERLTEKMIQTHDNKKLVKYFKELILRSYGEKSDDGFQFMKSKEISRRFEQSPAYDILFMELSTSAEKCAEFVNGIVPSDISKRMKEEQNNPNMNPALASIQGKALPLASAQAKENE